MPKVSEPRYPYWLFGLPIDSDIELPLVPRKSGQAVAEICASDRGGRPQVWCLDLALPTPDGEGRYQFSLDDVGLHLRVDPVGQFVVTPARITYSRLDASSREAFEWQLLGPVVGLWLEALGWPTLHGACVDLNGKAAALLAPSGVGKSTFAVSFLRTGYRVLGDDHVALQTTRGTIAVPPALPWMKISDSVMASLGLEAGAFSLVHPLVPKRRVPLPISSTRSSVPLGAVFLLSRRPDEHGSIRVERLPGSEGLMSLVRNTYAPRTVAAARLQRERIPVLAHVACVHGVHKLTYPSGSRGLELAQRAIVDHVANGPTA